MNDEYTEKPKPSSPPPGPVRPPEAPPREFQTQEETTILHPAPTDERCKDYDPDPYIPPPPRCSDYVHYAPCALALGHRRRDIRPWYQRLMG